MLTRRQMIRCMRKDERRKVMIFIYRNEGTCYMFGRSAETAYPYLQDKYVMYRFGCAKYPSFLLSFNAYELDFVKERVTQATGFPIKVTEMPSEK